MSELTDLQIAVSAIECAEKTEDWEPVQLGSDYYRTCSDDHVGLLVTFAFRNGKTFYSIEEGEEQVLSIDEAQRATALLRRAHMQNAISAIECAEASADWEPFIIGHDYYETYSDSNIEVKFEWDNNQAQYRIQNGDKQPLPSDLAQRALDLLNRAKAAYDSDSDDLEEAE